jgi:hypothetical protein
MGRGGGREGGEGGSGGRDERREERKGERNERDLGFCFCSSKPLLFTFLKPLAF